ncbi:MAG: hypothetical protein LBT20_07900 [Clostridiales bacterium]|jgi:hypothetical protein|nr:hypothetical protein [Clostridiales bacterium]
MDTITFTKARATFFRVLKIVSYLAGIPLLLYVVYGDAKALSGFGVTAGSGMSAFKIIALCFGTVVALQVVAGLLLGKKDFFVRALIVTIAASAATFIPVLFIDTTVKAAFGEMRAEYSTSGEYDFERYERQLSDYLWRADNHEKAKKSFLSTYNLEGTVGTTKGGNLDGTPTTAAGDKNGIFLKGFEDYTHYVFGSEVGAAYSLNGLYADGFVFGYNQAEYLLSTYYKVKNDFASRGLDADKELKNALDALDAGDTVWTRYQLTTEYLRAYGAAPAADRGAEKIKIGNGEYDVYKLFAAHYYLTTDEIKSILNTLAGNLAGLPVTGDLVTIIEGLNTLIGLNLSNEVLDILRDYRALDYDALMKVLDDLKIDIGGEILNEAYLLKFISEFSYYQSPTTYPKMFFIGDSALRDYAYAKYLGTKHGATVGSVLIGDKVGAITLDNGGSSPKSESELTALFARIRIESEFMPKYYPWLALRAGLVKFGGIVPAAMILAYIFADAEKKNINRLIAKGGKA